MTSVRFARWSTCLQRVKTSVVTISPLLVQTAGSLAAILALSGLAWWMKLGGAPKLDSVEAVQRAAGEVEDGFTPIDVACDAEGASALARDAAGQIMLVRRHGNRLAGRLLTPQASAVIAEEMDRYTLTVDPGEARFGKTTLVICNPATWANAINRI